MNFTEQLERLRSRVQNTYGLYNLAPWLQKNTFLDGRPFSFKDHEFQLDILACTAPTSIIVKCAQIGMSELAYRYAIATCCNMDDWTLIYTFPSSSDAEKNCKTRIDPLIESSPVVKQLVNQNLNNSEVKQFGRNSFLFFKGTFSATQALSTPANAVIHDEWDKSDTTQGSVYVSRLQHKPHKLRKIFSTPTIEKFGVSKEAETARRLKHMATCNRCGHVFLPDYFEHIIVPGWDKPLEEITKKNLHRVNWRDAYLQCPHCKRDPQLHYTRMQFLCENNDEQHDANAWYISPFSAHNILTPSYLVKVSTQFEKFSEFKNQTLGLTAEDKNDQLTHADIVGSIMQADLRSSEFHCLGADMGITCRIVIGRVSATGEFVIVHRERVYYTKFHERVRALTAEYRCISGVIDSQPYADLTTTVCNDLHNFWGAVFVTTKGLKAFSLEEQEEDQDEGKLAMRMVKLNRTVVLDSLMQEFKDGNVVIQAGEEDEEYVVEMQSLKRVQKYTADKELTYIWEKTGDENDHYHLATMYCHVATKLRAMVRTVGTARPGRSLVKRFKSKL